MGSFPSTGPPSDQLVTLSAFYACTAHRIAPATPRFLSLFGLSGQELVRRDPVALKSGQCVAFYLEFFNVHRKAPALASNQEVSSLANLLAPDSAVLRAGIANR